MLNFKSMTDEYANLIMSKNLSGNFECFNIEHEPEDIDDLLDKEGYDFFVAVYDGELIGFIECYFEDKILEVGLAIFPDFIKEGFGTEFVSQAIEFLITEYDYTEDVIRSYVNIKDKKGQEIMKRVGFYVIDTARDWKELEITI